MQQHAILDIEGFAATSIFWWHLYPSNFFKELPFSLYEVRILCFHHIDILLLKIITRLARNKNVFVFSK